MARLLGNATIGSAVIVGICCLLVELSWPLIDMIQPILLGKAYEFRGKS